MHELFWGCLISLILAAPFGPQGALAVVHALAGRHRHALAVAGGACVADAVLIALARYPATLHDVIHPAVLSGSVAVILVGMAYVLWRQATPTPAPHTWGSVGASFSFGLGHTVMHPANLAAYTVALGWVMAQNYLPQHNLNIGALMVGSLVGSVIVWAGVLLLARRLGNFAAFTATLPKITRVLAVLMLGLALFTAMQALRSLL
jgi:threonine/homoserine/homoserine lactone efflux protein